MSNDHKQAVSSPLALFPRLLILGALPNENVAVDGGWLDGSFDVTNAWRGAFAIPLSPDTRHSSPAACCSQARRADATSVHIYGVRMLLW